MSVKLHEVMSAARARSASLASEVAGYLILAVADQIAGAPRGVGFSDVTLSEEGQLRIAGGTPVEDVRAEATLREMLGLMLLESSSVTPSLMRAAHKPAAAGVDALIREIEVALVPVNRAAARRALARLHRDVDRARSSGRMASWQPPAPSVPAQVPSAPEPVKPKVQAPVAALPEQSVDLPAVLAKDSEPPPVAAGERSWLTPDTVAVIDVEWPERPALESDDALLTAIPIHVEELVFESAPPAVPTVPDLEVPPSEDPPQVHTAPLPEPVTVPGPLVAPKREPEATAGSSTPVLGSALNVTEHGVFVPCEEPTPAPLLLAGDDATERMPPVCPEEVASPVVAVAAEAGLELETLDPPPAAEPALEPPLEAGSSAPEVQLEQRAAPEPPSFCLEMPSPTPAPMEPSPRAALAELAGLPPRPERHDFAPPRYAPRKSDIEELLSGFGVASVKTERELCSDLKALAGVEQTAPPPAVVELSETPPPVAVMEIDEARPSAARASEGSNARVVAGAVAVALVVAGVGLGSIPTRGQGEGPLLAARAAVAVDSEKAPAQCSAELTVRRVPLKSRARVRSGNDGPVIEPSRRVGNDAVFEGLACGQSAEVTVELPGRARWVRIPVTGEALSPRGSEPSLVRYTVAMN